VNAAQDDLNWRHTWLGSERVFARRVALPVARFLRIEAAGGLLMLVGTVAALVWFNVGASSYETFWHTGAALEIGGFDLDLSLHEWINDGLMTLFFFVVGMEIKREMVSGELRDPRTAALPVIAALGGMAVPAAIYAALNASGDGSSGWGIPMATDIAFAVGIVSLLGSRVPVQLKLFLLTLAVADDLGGIAVIALFYSAGLEPIWLLGAVGMLATMYVLRRLGVWYFPVYVVLGVVAWYFMYRSGVHATIAGVVAGFLTPTKPLRESVDAEAIADQLEGREELTAADVRSASFLIKESVPVNERLTNLLHPWTGFVIIPLFALSNAAIPLNGAALSDAWSSRVTWGVALGLLIGKAVGVSGMAWLALATGVARRPIGMNNLHIVGVSLAAGIGFTVAIFITGLSLDALELQNQAKVGIFVASFLAAVASAFVLIAASKRETPADRARDAAEEAALFAERPDRAVPGVRPRAGARLPS
jgi:Na+:H+ antiporter, NhaA family